MSKLAQLDQLVQSNTQSNTQEILKQNVNSETFTNQPIDKTPFRIIGNKEEGYAIVLGAYLLTERYDTKEETIQKLETDHWNITANLIITLTEIIEEQKEIIKKHTPIIKANPDKYAR